MRGLLGRAPLLPDQALLITSCSSIHTFFMQYPIDLAFINNKWQIKKLIPALKPFRMAWVSGTSMVVEMPVGTIEQIKLFKELCTSHPWLGKVAKHKNAIFMFLSISNT
jgi:uncharacterized membrane protein (UPF0127 family)